MRALLVLPAVLALGAWDVCTVTLPDGRSDGTGALLLSHQLNLAACVARVVPRALLQGTREDAKAKVRAACVGDAVASQSMTLAQATALTDRLVDQEINVLEKCPF
jgi:hypothetical protein